MASTLHRKRLHERLIHAAWAAGIALGLSALSLLSPLDQFIWIAQARGERFEASGNIVFVGTERDLADPDFPRRREDLARAIGKLRQAGTSEVYVDIAFPGASHPASDLALNQALRGPGGRAYLIRSITSGFGSEAERLEKSTAPVARGVAQVGGERAFHMLGIVWSMPYTVERGGTKLVSAAVMLAGKPQVSATQFPINYGFRAGSIPTTRLADILDAAPQQLTRRFAGKQVVIGRIGPQTDFVIPGDIAVPGGLVHIYAAETLKAGFTQVLPELPLLLGSCLLLVLIVQVRSSSRRRVLYGTLVLYGPACVAVTMDLGARPQISGLSVLLLVFLSLRLRAKWKKEILLVDQDTGLPTFAALEADRQVARAHPTIVVAKMHRFEEVRQSLPAELHAEYVLRIIDRLNAAAPGTRIYVGPGHLIAWCMAEEDQTMVKDHLEGLRALFASPLQVGGTQVDVGITFGADISPSRDVPRRLVNAVAATERTTETYLPILIAEAKSDEELIWNISLQARIDAALSQGEIFLVYQPKIRIDTGDLVGMEALVRWRDPVRGLIPPDSFIKQCEETGRMSHLTRHVLLQACRAGAATGCTGATFSIAVNISATLLHDGAIVAMVREVLKETGFDPARLTLEITETYRISDMAVAEVNLHQLTLLGASISIDDFGVGEASMEALLRLPFTELKIDRVFIDRLGQRPRALGIVRSMLELGRQLRIAVVAEGVEDDATLDLLRQSGCRLAQGFGICRPVPFDEAVQFGDRGREKPMRINV